jgi:hypothetical protein
MTTYIAGPMTGYPEFNYPAFEDAAKALRASGIDVISPHELHGSDTPASYTAEQSYAWYLRAALRALLDCDEIVLLPGWANSDGAQLERRIAEALGMHVIEWVS